MSRPLELDDLFSLRSAGDPQLSPDGTRVVFVVTRADEEADENLATLWLVDAEGDAAPRQLTNGPSDASPRWTPDGTAVLFVRKGPGAERPQVWRLPLGGGEPTALTDLAGGVTSFVLAPEGDRLVATSIVDLAPDRPATAPVEVDRLGYKADGAGLVGTRRSHLFLVDLEGGTSRQLTEGEASGSGPAWSPDGTRLAFVRADHDDRDLRPGSSVRVLDVDGGDVRRVTDETASAAGVVWLDDHRLLFAGKPSSAPGHARLYTVDADADADGDAGPAELAPGFDRNVMLGAPAYPGSVPRVAGDHVLFCARDRGCTHVYRVPIGGGTPERVAGSADATASSITVDASGRRLAYLQATPRSPGDVVVADAPSGDNATARTQLAVEGVDLLVPEPRVFAAPDGIEVHGWVLRAPGTTGPGPLLLDVHGGPHNAWNPTFDGMHLYHQVLAAQGWTILFLNPRGSDGYGEAFYTAVVEGWGTADLDDFLAPVDALVAEGLADPDRLAVTGYSYGGFMTCWLTSRTDRFAAAIAGGSVTNQVSLFGSSDLGLFLGDLELGGRPGDAARKLEEHSPITYVGAVTAPTLLLHGERDDRCPIEQAEQWFAALRAREVPTRMVRYPGGSHLFIALGRPSHRLDYNRRVVDWLNEHVPVS